MHIANENRILVSLNAVCEMTSLSRTAINKARAKGQFPAEVNLGERRIAFVRTEVEDWIHARVEARLLGRKARLPLPVSECAKAA